MEEINLHGLLTDFSDDLRKRNLPLVTAALSAVYCVSCLAFRIGTCETVSREELVQLFAAFGLSLALAAEPDAIHPWTVLVALSIMRWVYVVQIRGPVFDPRTALDMDGRVIVLTGCTSGIGLECAKEIGKHFPGAKLILACRDLSKGEALRHKILEKNKDADVLVESLDLDSFASIQKFAERCKSKFERIDVLVNNAGAMFLEQAMTKDNNERTLQTNCLSPFLLTSLLLPLIHSKDSMRRIIIVTSSTSKLKKPIRFDDLDYLIRPKEYSMLGTYAHSKISLTLCHPGAVQTDVTRHMALWLRLGHKSIRPLCKKSRDGCQTILYLMASQEVEGVSGLYFEHMQPIPVYKRPDEDLERFFKICEERCKIDFSAVVQELDAATE